MREQRDVGSGHDPQATHVVLLRDRRAGGRIVPMRDLRDFLIGLGWTAVASHGGSGSLVGRPPGPAHDDDGATDAATAACADRLNRSLAQGLGLAAGAVVVHRDDLAQAVRQAPTAADDVPGQVQVVAFAEPRTPAHIEQIAARQRAMAAHGSGERALIRGRWVFVHHPRGRGRSTLARHAARPLGDSPAQAGATRTLPTLLAVARLLDIAETAQQSALPDT